MNKSRSTLLAALAIAASVHTGFAAENTESTTLSMTGGATLKWEKNNPTGQPSEHVGEQTLKLNFSQPLSEKFSLYARFAYRNFSGDDTTDSIHEFDQFGLIYKTANGTLTLGSQEGTLGTLNGLVELTEVGRDNMFLGANWASESEQGNLHFLTGRVDKNLLGTQDDINVTGIEASKEIGKVTLAAEYLHVSDQPEAGSMYGLGLKTAVDKWEFSVEGLRSTAKQAKSGYLTGVTYSLAENDILSATYRNLKPNSVVTGLARYDADTKGWELAWEKSLSERWSVKLSQEWLKGVTTQDKDRVTTLETTYTF